MRVTDISELARHMLDAYGAQAVVQAAQKAVSCEQRGEIEEASTWRHIENALKLMRGPHQS